MATEANAASNIPAPLTSPSGPDQLISTDIVKRFYRQADISCNFNLVRLWWVFRCASFMLRNPVQTRELNTCKTIKILILFEKKSIFVFHIITLFSDK